MADNILKVETQVNVAPLKDGMAQASAATQQAAAEMSGSLKTVEQATADLAAAQADMAAIVKAVGGAIDESNAAWGVYADAQQRAATAAAELAAAQAAAASAATAGAGAATAAAAATDEESAAHMRLVPRLSASNAGIRLNASAIGSLVPLIGVAAVAMGVELVDKLKDAEIELNNFAQAAGVSVESLATLQQAIAENGGSAKDLNSAWRQLNENIARLRTGDTEIAKAFAELGINLAGVLDGSLSLDQIFVKIADDLQDGTNTAQMAGAAQIVLGASSMNLLGAMKQLNAAQLDAGSSAAVYGKAIQDAEPDAVKMQGATATLGARAKEVGLMFLSWGASIATGLEKGMEALDKFRAAMGNPGEGTLANFGIGPGAPSAGPMPQSPFAGPSPNAKFSGAGGDFTSDAERNSAAVNTLVAAIMTADAAGKDHKKTLEANIDAIRALAATVEGQASPALQKYAAQLEQIRATSVAKETSKLAEAARKVSSAQQEFDRKSVSAGIDVESMSTKRISDEADIAAASIIRSAQSAARAYKEQEAAAQESYAGEAQAIESKAALDKATLDQSVAAHKASGQQELQQQLAINQQEHDAMVALLDQELAALDKNDTNYLAEKQRINNEIQTANEKLAISNVQAHTQSLNTITRSWATAFNSINRTLDESVRGVIMGTETMGQAWVRLGANLLASMVEAFAKMELKSLETELAMRLQHTATIAQKAATDAAAVAASETTRITFAIGAVTSNAAVAASGAYAATAMIPFVGPELAPAAAASAEAGTLAFLPQASFDVGAWKIPDDITARVHAGEMIVPAGPAETFRRALSGTPGSSTVHIHMPPVSAMDFRGVDQVLQQHSDAIGKIVSTLVRKGKLG